MIITSIISVCKVDSQKSERRLILAISTPSLTMDNRCQPAYLTQKAHAKLSMPGAFDGLRIHTDEINEVIKRITPGTLTIAVVSRTMLSTLIRSNPTVDYGFHGLV